MMKFVKWLDTVWDWFVYSSENPDQISSTLKFGFLTVGVLLTGALGFAQLHFPTDQWTAIGDSTISLVQNILLVVGSVGTVVSGIRKLWLTLKGQNATLNSTVTS